MLWKQARQEVRPKKLMEYSLRGIVGSEHILDWLEEMGHITGSDCMPQSQTSTRRHCETLY
jgi:hypothetical protein